MQSICHPRRDPHRAGDTPGAAPPAAGRPPRRGRPPSGRSARSMKFKSCRWRCAPEDGEFCTHRDVLPFAGKNDFKADSWCPECAFYKLRRTPKKRERIEPY